MDKAGGVPVPRPKWTPQSDRAGEASSSARSGDEQIQSGTFDGFFKDALSAA